MKAFRFVRPRDCAEAVASSSMRRRARACYARCGVDLLDRMKERLDEPGVVVGLLDASRDGRSSEIAEERGHPHRGAQRRSAQLAASDVVRQASCPRWRRRPARPRACSCATARPIGGNLAQHTRCGYYRLASFPCLKRGGDHCPVRKDGGVQEHAGIVANDPCASAHPSSVAPVLGSLDAEIVVRDPKSVRTDSRSGTSGPPRSKGVAGDTVLGPADVIQAVRDPRRGTSGSWSGITEVRHRWRPSTGRWSSCSVRYAVEGETIKDARVWFGSLAPTPWRAEEGRAGADRPPPARMPPRRRPPRRRWPTPRRCPGRRTRSGSRRSRSQRALAAARERSAMDSARDGEYRRAGGGGAARALHPPPHEGGLPRPAVGERAGVRNGRAHLLVRPDRRAPRARRLRGLPGELPRRGPARQDPRLLRAARAAVAGGKRHASLRWRRSGHGRPRADLLP